MSMELIGTRQELKGKTRKPRVALMGEFSAGKSTLTNLLLGQGVSPVKVTATQLPPVWYSFGPEAISVIDATNQTTKITPDELEAVSPHDTRVIRSFLETEVLEFCDLIDMPGTSDPNMARNVWADVLAIADAVVWCTPSTQAWRQSEAAIWDEMSEELHDNSLLLITRMDKLVRERDRARVVARVRSETDGLFRDVYPVALLQAIEDRDNPEALQTSGADAFVDALIALIEDLKEQVAADKTPERDLFAPDEAAAARAGPDPKPVLPRRLKTPEQEPMILRNPIDPLPVDDTAVAETASGGRILPRRVRLNGTPGGRGRTRG